MSSDRNAYLDNRHLALRIIGSDGFATVRDDVGDRMTPARASKIMSLMRDEYGITDIDKGLADLAAEKKTGRMGGTVRPPVPGETREYVVNKLRRVMVPVAMLGKNPGDTVRIVYEPTGIMVKK